MKKVGKTTRPLRYDLNQIPYNYTVEVRNRFKGLDLIECLMNYGMRFVTLYRRQGSRPSPWKRNAKSKIAVWGGLTNSCEKKRGKKERYKHLNAEFQRIARRDRKAFFSGQCKEIEENNRMGKTRDLFKKIRYEGNFSCKDGHNKGQAKDIKKRWQEYTEELYKKELHNPDNHDGVITHLEPDILE